MNDKTSKAVEVMKEIIKSPKFVMTSNDVHIDAGYILDALSHIVEVAEKATLRRINDDSIFEWAKAYFPGHSDKEYSKFATDVCKQFGELEEIASLRKENEKLKENLESACGTLDYSVQTLEKERAKNTRLQAQLDRGKE